MSETAYDRVAREDVVLFVNAAITSTGQTEFHSDAAVQRLSLAFLHSYVLGNYRQLYASTPALDLNDHNAALVIGNLLRSASGDDKVAEGQLIAARLRRLPPQRVYRLFDGLRRDGVNNRRTRAIMREWVSARPDLAFDAVKYRRRLVGRDPGARSQAVPDPDRAPPHRRRAVAAAFGFGAYRRAGTRPERAARPPDAICPLAAAARAQGASQELSEALRAAASRAVGRQLGSWGRVVSVLDDSFSASGSAQRRRHPLAVALGVHYLVDALATDHTALWLSHRGDPLLVHPVGATPLGDRLLDALERRPDRVVVVSDGWDNAPPGQVTPASPSSPATSSSASPGSWGRAHEPSGGTFVSRTAAWAGLADLAGLTAGPAQVWGGVISYVPHAFVATWTDDGTPAATYGTQLPDKLPAEGMPLVFRRLVRRGRGDDGRRLRFLPQHLAMEGYLALHFGGPSISWEEWTNKAVTQGLSPRSEAAYLGTEVPGLDDALRIFEIHPGQCGLLLFVADALAGAFVVPHPTTTAPCTRR